MFIESAAARRIFRRAAIQVRHACPRSAGSRWEPDSGRQTRSACPKEASRLPGGRLPLAVSYVPESRTVPRELPPRSREI